MAKLKYTILHIPTGVTWEERLLFDKKSQAVAWLKALPVDDDGNFNPPKRVRLQFLHKALENPFQYAKDKEMRHNLIVLFTGLIPFLTGNQARINEEIMRIFGISEFVPVAIKASTLRALAKSWDPENDY